MCGFFFQGRGASFRTLFLYYYILYKNIKIHMYYEVSDYCIITDTYNEIAGNGTFTHWVGLGFSEASIFLAIVIVIVYLIWKNLQCNSDVFTYICDYARKIFHKYFGNSPPWASTQLLLGRRRKWPLHSRVAELKCTGPAGVWTWCRASCEGTHVGLSCLSVLQ